MGINISCADAVKWAQEYEGELFHALLCDPPYHLTSIVKRFGKQKSNAHKSKVTGSPQYKRLARGFMGKRWDGGDVAFDPDTWAAFARVMYPGAFGMAFASSRGWHRLAVAIEDGGFIIHPSIFGWAYGSGFPKATRVNHGVKGFEGYRYGLQALKPALEPIIVFQKPYEGKPYENITRTGAGVLNVDGGRIGVDEIPSNQWIDNAHPFGGGTGNEYETVTNKGRWPANFYVDSEAAKRLDRQTGRLVSGEPAGIRHATNNIYGQYQGGMPVTGYGDDGGASRFFFNVSDQIDEADPVYYCAKAGNDERNAGLKDFDSQTVNDGRKKSIDNAYQRGETQRNNTHPTVKPIDLDRYLATLLLPPTEYQPRRLFVPFAGVASEMIGAMQAGWDEITGVELTEEYIPIARARVEYWRNRGWQTNLF